MTATQLLTGELQASPVTPLSPSAHTSAVEDARVLVADDDPSARLLLVGLLERAGFWRVDAAAGGRMALAAMINGGNDGRTANTPSDGRQTVRIAKADGYEFIKVYSQLNVETFKAIVDEARIQGMKEPVGA